MKKFIKNNIIGFILGAVIFGSIGAVSAYTILANDIGYTPNDNTWNVNNVKDAIDELYNNRINLNNIEFLDSHKLYSDMSSETRTNSLNLSKGTYFVFISDFQGWDGSAESSNYIDYNLSYNINNSGICNVIGGKAAISTTNRPNLGFYLKARNIYEILLCDVPSNSTISYELMSNKNNSQNPIGSIMSAIKIKS